MEKKDIIAFFDRCAPNWDADMVKNIRNQMARESVDSLISSLKELGYSEEEMIQMIRENWKDA